MKSFFTLKHFRGDLLGGITAGIVALPLALAFGVSSGLGPSAGLYGAIFLSFFAALFGGTPTQISGPTAPITAVSMVVIAGIIGSNDGEVSKALPIILSIFLLAGIIQVLLGVVGVGKYIKYIPYPVVSGFMTAIGVIIIVTQIIPSLGYYPKNDTEYVQQFRPQAQAVILNNILKDEAGENILVLDDLKQTVARAEKVTPAQVDKEAKTLASSKASGVLGSITILPRALQNIKWIELILAASTIVIVYGFRKITNAVPSTLVALLLVSGIAYFFGLAYQPIQEIPFGLPMPQMKIFSNFSFTQVMPYLFTALSLALLGAIDSLLTSVVADNMTKTKHNPNRELLGQGIGNSLAAIFGGIPGAGATIRTVVNIRSGGKTKLSGMIAGLLVLIILVALGPVASKIPAAVLSGILITVGIGVMDYKGLKAIPSMPRSEVIIMLVVLILSSLWNLVYAVGIGLVIASLMFMKKIGDITAKGSQILSLATDNTHEDDFDFPARLKEEVFIKHINGPLFFGYTSDFQQLSAQIPTTASTVVIRMENMTYIDQSGLYALEDVLHRLNSQNIQILLTGILPQPRYMMERINIIPQLVSEDHIFTDYHSCLIWIEKNVRDVV